VIRVAARQLRTKAIVEGTLLGAVTIALAVTGAHLRTAMTPSSASAGRRVTAPTGQTRCRTSTSRSRAPCRSS
jgi:hypothetical protein